MAKIPSICVTRLQPLHDAGNLLAYADILIANILTVREVRLVRQAGQAAWVSGPTRTYEVNGQRRFLTYVDFPAEWRPHITATVVAAFEDHPEGIRSLNEPGQGEQPSPFRQEVRQKAGIGGAR